MFVSNNFVGYDMAVSIKKIPTLPVIRMLSFSGNGAVYEVDRGNKSCTCPAFIKEGYCKHLEHAGVYKVGNWKPSSHPTFSQALSGLVKCIRLRRVEDAVYWLTYLYNFKEDGKGYRFRLARRLLIGSAEDGHSIAVMELVARNFPTLCRQDTPLYRLVAEVVRICGVPNWWDPSTNGPDYIYKGMVSNRRAWFYREGGANAHEQFQQLRDRVSAQDGIGALTSLERLIGDRGLKREELAKYLFNLANDLGNVEARRLTLIHLNHKYALSQDANFLCQAVWHMAGGHSDVVDTIHVVRGGDVMPLIEQAQEKWKHPQAIGEWCCDGIHCAGNDRRFAGIWHDMYAVCRAYAYYGDVEPSRAWLPDFYSLDGLNLAQ